MTPTRPLLKGPRNGKVVCRKIKRKEKINGKRKLRIKSQKISQLTFRKKENSPRS